MNALRQILMTIHDEAGELTPGLVVDAARAEDHPLHNRFNWDDTTAAECWRRAQAGDLIRSVRIKYADTPKGPKHLRAFVAIKGEESHQSSYEPTETAMADPFIRALILRDMNREWRSFRKRYEHMAEFASMIRNENDEAAS